MRVTYRAAAVLTSTALLGLAGLTITAAHADTFGPTDFESPAYTVGNINGQQGWSMTGSYDVAVANISAFPNAAGFGFGAQALRASDAVTSGGFGDQTFSPGLAQPAGEAALGAKPYFQASFLIGSTLAAQQPGLHMSVSPDKGDGSRMSYLRFEDQADGIHVFFDDVTDAGPAGTVATFNESAIATLDRTHAHSVKFDISFVDGPGNDVAKIYIDGVLAKTGTTWEDYYRYDPEQAPSNAVPTVDKLLFRESGNADSGNAGNGFLIDGVTLTSAPPCTFTPVNTTTGMETLTGNCFTDHTISIPDGVTLNGNGYTITAVEPASGDFLGAVVANGGANAGVTNLTVTTSDLAGCYNGAEGLRGILFDDAAGSITNNTVIHVNRGQSGCQEGNGIQVLNPTSTQRAVTISGNTVSDYQKNGITAKGDVAATITNNTVTGSGPIGYIAQNGIQVSSGATALVKGNTVSGNWYTGSSWVACGFLIYQAAGVRASSNTLFANQQNQCNVGKSGGKFAPAS